MTTIKADDPMGENLPAPPLDIPAWQRCLLICFGWVMIAIGIIGILVPVLPTTVFMIMALWAFSRSSRRFQLWVWTHPHFGPAVRDWHHFGAIPVRAKVSAVIVMTASFAFLVVISDLELWIYLAVASVMLSAGAYIVSRPSAAPRP